MSATVDRAPRRGLVHFSAPISRVEAGEDGSLLVAGTAVTETPVVQMLPDGRRRPLVLDYEGVKAASEKYAKNIREMHQSIAVGRAIEVIPSDDKRAVELVAFVSAGAKDTQIKVRDGTLRSYSIGCDPISWRDEGDITRVTAIDWVETSLVDVGADPGTNDLVVLSRGAHLEPGLTGRMEESMEKPAAPAADSLIVGETKVTIDANGTAVVEPIVTRAAAPAPAVPQKTAEDPAPKTTSAATAPADGAPAEEPNRFARAMTAALKREGDAEMSKAHEPADAKDGDEKPGDAKDDKGPDADEDDGIKNEADLMSAIRSMSYADDVAMAKSKIKAAAKRLGLTDKLPRTWRASRPELVRSVVEGLGLQRHHMDGSETDDLSCAIGLVREAEWLCRGIECLLASELAESVSGDPAEAGQVALLQGAAKSCAAICAALKEFIADEASEGIVASAPGAEPAPAPEPVENEAGSGVEMSAKPRMVRGMASIARRLAALEKKITVPAAAPAFSAEDAEQLAAAMGSALARTVTPITKTLDDLGNEVKVVRGELGQVLALPRPFGAARGLNASTGRSASGAGSNGNDISPETELAILRRNAELAPDPISKGFMQHLVHVAEAKLPPR